MTPLHANGARSVSLAVVATLLVVLALSGLAESAPSHKPPTFPASRLGASTKARKPHVPKQMTEDLARRHAAEETARAAVVAAEENVKEEAIKRPDRERMAQLDELERVHLQAEQGHKEWNAAARQMSHDIRRQMFRENKGKRFEEERAKTDVAQAKQIMRAINILERLVANQDQVASTSPNDAVAAKRARLLRVQLEQYQRSKMEWHSMEEEHKQNEHARKAMHHRWSKTIAISEHKMKEQIRRAFRNELATIKAQKKTETDRGRLKVIDDYVQQLVAFKKEEAREEPQKAAEFKTKQADVRSETSQKKNEQGMKKYV